jgi:hypothetical protein
MARNQNARKYLGDIRNDNQLELVTIRSKGFVEMSRLLRRADGAAHGETLLKQRADDPLGRM